MMAAANALLDGKRKVKKAREQIAKSGPLLGEAIRPSVLEPALAEYHDLRQKHCTTFPLLASLERDEDKLAELASGASAATPGAKGPTASDAFMRTREVIRRNSPTSSATSPMSGIG